MLWKFGINYDKENLKLGINVTTPKLYLSIIPGSLRRNVFVHVPGETTNTPIQATNQQKVPTVHKLPLQLDLGAEYKFGPTSVSGRLGYSHKISTYSLLKQEDPTNEIQEILASDNELFNNMQDASKSILNFGLGFIHILTKGWAILGGYRTDFNYFNEKELSRQEHYVPSISYWDLHHLSGGFTRFGERYYLSLGLSYGFGRTRGIQEINLTAPSLENDLFGARDMSAYAKYNQIILNIGFTYLFER